MSQTTTLLKQHRTKVNLPSTIKENFVFLREFLLEFQTTGACFPTSRWAAQTLIAPLREEGRAPKSILELGPGTGSVTIPLIEVMREDDTLTICEINPRFMKALKERLESNPFYQRNRDRIHFFEGPAQDLPTNTKYDMVVCALPFLNFDIETVSAIFSRLREICTPETLMTYYEYIGLNRLSQAIAPDERKQRMSEVVGYLKKSPSIELLTRQRVWRNVLPINIYTIKPAANG